MKLRPGERIGMRDALYAMMLSSDNFAALTVADHVGRQLLVSRAKRGEPVNEFVGEMNRLAKGLGMRQTRFRNPQLRIAQMQHPELWDKRTPQQKLQARPRR